MLVGDSGLYEDNDPTTANGLAGDVIAQDTVTTAMMAGGATTYTITLSGTTLTGGFSALAYGGFRAGTGFTNVAVVGTGSGQLFFRGESGAAFTDVSAALTAAGRTGGISAIALDPQDWRRVFVTDGNGVFFTSDITNLAANPWKEIGGGANDNLAQLTNTGTPAATQTSSATVVDVGGMEVPLIGAFGGVYRTILPAAMSSAAVVATTWTQFGTGLPTTIAKSITYNAAADVLVAGTFGRGGVVHCECLDLAPFVGRIARLRRRAITR